MRGKGVRGKIERAVEDGKGEDKKGQCGNSGELG